MKTILTGIKATGVPHWGNYFGAIRPALDMVSNLKHKDDRFYFFIADYHSLTSVRDPKVMEEYTYEVAAMWLACGLDPERVTIYRQSDIPEVMELFWMLTCHIPKGDLNRAHAYKAARDENEARGQEDLDHGVNAGLFLYPVLMAADIMLFDSDFVPVGKDQVQHIEMARSIAQRMNGLYKAPKGEKFVLKEPKELIQSEVATVIGLDGRKMSKSYQNSIPLFATENELKKLINRVTTDSLPPEVPKRPEDSFLFKFFELFGSEEEIANLRKRYEAGVGWGEVKQLLHAKANEHFSPMREIYFSLMNDRSKIDTILKEGARKASLDAKNVIRRVKQSVMGR
ncbi:MAG: tryptophan--tRNA ligase [Bacteriovoracaceae bacterium]|nr:tryptophan--tRNA ligase [Bacteriovoracaceae bacterium]